MRNGMFMTKFGACALKLEEEMVVVACGCSSLSREQNLPFFCEFGSAYFFPHV